MSIHSRLVVLLAFVLAIPSIAPARTCADEAEENPYETQQRIRARPENVAKGDLSSYKIDEEHPEESIPTAEQAMKTPLQMGYLMMDLVARADAATIRGEHAAAVRYYKAIAKAVPERAVAFSKMCRSYKELGDIDNAREACRGALGRGGVTAEDYAMFVKLTLSRAQAPTQGEIEELDEVVAHLEKELDGKAGAELEVAQLRCEIGARLEDDKRLTRCVSDLGALAANDPRTFAYRWALALKHSDIGAAQRVIDEAQQAGLPDGALRSMRAKLELERAKQPGWLQFAEDWRVVAAVAFLVVLGLVVALSRRAAHGLRAT